LAGLQLQAARAAHPVCGLRAEALSQRESCETVAEWIDSVRLNRMVSSSDIILLH